MVVLDDIRGLEVTVQVSGRTAREYNNPDQNERPEMTADDFFLPTLNQVPGRPLPHVVKYIEAEPGKQFAVHVKRTPQFTRVGSCFFFQVTADGNKGSNSPTDEKIALQNVFNHTCSYIQSITPEGYQEHHFKFGNLDVGEVENLNRAELKKQVDKAKTWGTIIVKCYHSTGTFEAQWGVDQTQINRDHGRISEKAVKGKALDAVTEFDSRPLKPRPKVEYCIGHYDQNKRPFAVFEFRYRTKRGLVVEGVIPRTPSPTLEDEIQDMPDDEVRRLARELLARERKKSKTPAAKEENKRGIKREVDLTDEDPFAADVPPYKTQRRADGALEIDLTDLD